MKNKNILIPLLFLALFLGGKIQLFAQTHEHRPDSVKNAKSETHYHIDEDSMKIAFWYFEEDQNMFILRECNDTSMSNFQKHDPATRYNPFMATLGNLAMGAMPLTYSMDYSTDFDLGFHSLDAYTFDKKNIRFYDIEQPFSNVIYSNSTNSQHNFFANLDQNFSDHLYLGLNYQVERGAGNYLEQTSDATMFDFHGKFSIFENRYQGYMFYIYNRVENLRNGGIMYPYYFEDSTGISPFQIPTILNDAQTANRQHEFYVKHFFRPFAKSNWAIEHSFNSDSRKFEYIDNTLTETYYQHIYTDSTSTHDSSHYRIIENKLSIINRDENSGQNGFLFDLGLKHRYIRVYNVSETKYQQLQAVLDVGYKKDSNYQVQLKSNYVLGEINDKDFASYLMGRYRLNKSTDLLFRAIYKNQAPDYWKQSYISNHFIWNTNFDKEERLSLNAAMRFESLIVNAEYAHIKNWVYYDSLALPTQMDASFDYIKFKAEHRWENRRFFIENRIVYQNTIGQDVLQLPSFMGSHTFAYSFDLIKKTLRTQIGVDIFYHTKYYAQSYNPVIGQFYLQDEKEVPANLYFDVFLNFEVQSAMVFVKVSHVNALIPEILNKDIGFISSSRNYYSIYPYPNSGFIVNFGVSWRFWE